MPRNRRYVSVPASCLSHQVPLNVCDVVGYEHRPLTSASKEVPSVVNRTFFQESVFSESKRGLARIGLAAQPRVLQSVVVSFHVDPCNEEVGVEPVPVSSVLHWIKSSTCNLSCGQFLYLYFFCKKRLFFFTTLV